MLRRHGKLQHTDNCRESICLLQGRDPNEVASQDEQNEDEILPSPSFENLPAISEEVTNILDMSKKRKISAFILQDNVI